MIKLDSDSLVSKQAFFQLFPNHIHLLLPTVAIQRFRGSLVMKSSESKWWPSSRRVLHNSSASNVSSFDTGRNAPTGPSQSLPSQSLPGPCLRKFLQPIFCMLATCCCWYCAVGNVTEDVPIYGKLASFCYISSFSFCRLFLYTKINFDSFELVLPSQPLPW